MTNDEKANELRKTALPNPLIDGYGMWLRSSDVDGVLIKMAKWKDERVKSCFILISKLIKDGLLKKDNSEHIMVEQMVELYNNLKI